MGQNFNSSRLNQSLPIRQQHQICDNHNNLEIFPTHAIDQEESVSQHNSILLQRRVSISNNELSSQSPQNGQSLMIFNSWMPNLEHLIREVVEQLYQINNNQPGEYSLQLEAMIGERNSRKQLSLKTSKQRSRKHTCSICFSRIKKGSLVPKLGCKHKFHKKCLNGWIERKLNCPLCRQSIE